MIRTFSLIAALLLASPLFVQDLPYAFLSTDPKEPTAEFPQAPIPNGAEPIGKIPVGGAR